MRFETTLFCLVKIHNERYLSVLPEWRDFSAHSLLLGAGDILRGDIKAFTEDDFSMEAILASGSLDEENATCVPPTDGKNTMRKIVDFRKRHRLRGACEVFYFGKEKEMPNEYG